MSTSHVCLQCGFDLATPSRAAGKSAPSTLRARVEQEPRYGLWIVRCPRCPAVFPAAQPRSAGMAALSRRVRARVYVAFTLSFRAIALACMLLAIWGLGHEVAREMTHNWVAPLDWFAAITGTDDERLPFDERLLRWREDEGPVAVGVLAMLSLALVAFCGTKLRHLGLVPTLCALLLVSTVLHLLPPTVEYLDAKVDALLPHPRNSRYWSASREPSILFKAEHFNGAILCAGLLLACAPGWRMGGVGARVIDRWRDGRRRALFRNARQRRRT